jgi:hypothetical protein
LNQPSQVRTLAGENIFVLCLIDIDATTFGTTIYPNIYLITGIHPLFVLCPIGIDTTTFRNYNISKHLPDHTNPPTAIDVKKQASNHYIEVCMLELSRGEAHIRYGYIHYSWIDHKGPIGR